MISASNCQTPYKKLTRMVKGPYVVFLANYDLNQRFEKFDLLTKKCISTPPKRRLSFFLPDALACRKESNIAYHEKTFPLIFPQKYRL